MEILYWSFHSFWIYLSISCFFLLFNFTHRGCVSGDTGALAPEARQRYQEAADADNTRRRAEAANAHAGLRIRWSQGCIVAFISWLASVAKLSASICFGVPHMCGLRSVHACTHTHSRRHMPTRFKWCRTYTHLNPQTASTQNIT